MLPSNVSTYCVFSGSLSALGGMVIGLCAPAVCKESDVMEAVKLMNGFSTVNMTHETVHCYTDTNRTHKPMTNGAIVMMVVCSVFALLLIIGTSIEYYINYQKTQPTSDKTSTADNNNSINDDKDQKAAKIYTPLQILLCFSIISNFQSFAYSSSDKKYFDSLDGIRVFSTCWVVLGHRHKKVYGWILALSLIALTFTTNIWLTLKYDIGTFFQFGSSGTEKNFATDIYTRPWTRVGPYAVGVLISFLYAEESDKRIFNDYTSSLLSH
eukprot:gene397-470_t